MSKPLSEAELADIERGKVISSGCAIAVLLLECRRLRAFVRELREHSWHWTLDEVQEKCDRALGEG